VHSYYAEKTDLASAVANYGIPFSAALARANFQAVQFHPEKSGEAGLQLLQNFLNL
jgi:glutamine amidotransferase